MEEKKKGAGRGIRIDRAVSLAACLCVFFFCAVRRMEGIRLQRWAPASQIFLERRALRSARIVSIIWGGGLLPPPNPLPVYQPCQPHTQTHTHIHAGAYGETDSYMSMFILCKHTQWHVFTVLCTFTGECRNRARTVYTFLPLLEAKVRLANMHVAHTAHNSILRIWCWRFAVN